ncbi:cytochrome P450 CYP82D47-like [Tripterygium wilfordii]|uniref:cytochrome P450 CYP82D47-like n=1 Tax=Tripterygium wilfordii TaxID=458696 RepID=UPI0018F821AB|nr:cytochrome P450 CYP82D47-like [Tripterygium wilfordii]
MPSLLPLQPPLMEYLLQSLLKPISTLFVLLICMWFYHLRRSKVRKTLCVPEAGGAWPIIGHLHIFNTQKPIHKTLSSMADKYGPVFTIRLGRSQRALILSSRELAKECFTKLDTVFSNRPNLAAPKLMGYDHAMFGFAPYGPYWRKMHKIITVHLMSSHRLDMLNHMRASEISWAIRELYESTCNANEVVGVDMEKWFTDLTYNLALTMVGGKRCFGASIDIIEDGEAQRCQKLVKDYVGIFFKSSVASKTRQFGGWLEYFIGNERAMKRSAKEMDILIGGWLEEHKQKRIFGGKVEEEEQDFMDILLDVMEETPMISGFDSDTIIKATCLNMLLGATESTKQALTMALSLLLENGHVLQKAQEELNTHIGKERCVTEDDIKNLTYLQAIVKETLRENSPSNIVDLITSAQDCTLSTGHFIPAGTQLMINAWKIHHDEGLWPDPYKFEPERFLTGNKNIDVKGRDYELIPFGSGRRICPGISLALRILHLTLSTLLHSFDVSKPYNTPVGATTKLQVHLTSRLDLKCYM